ncbi:MAG: serine/threonine-protein phosphatase [Burkholderiales bacterium]|nr:serine/threonine-protein phosphatase [Burkholderiales bacterium]
MKFSIYQESRKGGRRYNQDRMGYVFSRESLMMIVADGMGGHMHGEIAAQITVEFVGQKFQREGRNKLADPQVFLRDALNGAHAAILQYAEEHGLLETPRTTVVAAVVQDSHTWWAHAGDSRIYHIRAGQILSQTRDHSRVQQLVLQGVVREEAVAAHPDRNKIFNCLGAHVPPQIELSAAARLKAGDTLLLCSDGVWGPLPSRIIATAFLNDSVMRAVPEMMNQAERRAGADADNLSAVAMTWNEVDTAGPDSVSTLTLPAGDIASRIETFDQPAQHEYLSDDEIEKAIAEIRTAINKANRIVIK